MKLFFILVAVCTTVFGASIDDEYLEDYRLVSSRDRRDAEAYDLFAAVTTVEPVKCVKPGLMCGSCEEVMNCLDYGTGDEMEPELVETCDTENSFTCLNGECSTKPNSKCSPISKIEFKCKKSGVIFPDPSDCQVYYTCCGDTPAAYKKTCPKGYAFDPISMFCKTPIPNGCPVEPPVPYCNKAGQSGATKNKSIFYVCRPETIQGQTKPVLYPQLDCCPNGKSFINSKCT